MNKPEERKRIYEAIGMVVTASLLIALSSLEKDLFQLSERLSTDNREFFNSVVYFGLININVILILILSFLIFRNVVKLVIERRRGVIGSRLRSKLVISLVFFAVAPTALLFYVSSRFLSESFETWFSSRVESTIAKTREASSLVYKREKRRLESLARIGLQRIDVDHPHGNDEAPVIDAQRLDGFDAEYRLNSVKFYDHSGNLMWSNLGLASDKNSEDSQNEFIRSTLERFSENPGMTSRGVINVEQGRDVVKGAAPLNDPISGKLLGIIVTEERFETQIIRSVEAILHEFSGLKPGAQLIKLSYTILLLVMVLIIVFSATWLGFYVAKGIIGPIQSLAEATRSVAMGNYEIDLKTESDDETGHLIKSFNRMIDDLRSNRSQMKEFTAKLEATNFELDARRKYIEIILQNISAGVLSLDARDVITALNDAAERLLGLAVHHVIGLPIEQALGSDLFQNFWLPIKEGLSGKAIYNGQVVFQGPGGEVTLLVDANRILDENKVDLGCVIVFADASEQVKAQRVAAWREVARRIAHEIKNPITPIKLSAQRLLRRFSRQFEGEDRVVFGTCIETIIAEVDNLRDLVNEFSKFSRLPTIRPKKQNLNELIREVCGLYSMSYPSIEFDTSGLKADLPEVFIDKEQMNRVLSNLVVNAEASIRASRNPGKIEFRTEVHANLSVVRLEVIDNGMGIPDSIRSKIFEPYFSTKEEGTGLGLAIVNQIISDHGGYLRVGEPKLGAGGAVIMIDLPLSEHGNDKSTVG